MSWDFNRHHVAKKVLAKHMDELDKKQARISARRDENMRDIQRELMSLHSVSTPDLGTGTASPRISRKDLPALSRGASQSLTFGNGGTPTYYMRSDTRQSASLLYSRRQSEPVATVGRDLEDIQRLVNKATNLSDEAPDENWNRMLSATLPGGKSRLQQRRGTIAVTEELNKDGLVQENPAFSAISSPSLSRLTSRRGSLPMNASDLKTVKEETNVTSMKQQEGKPKNKKANINSSPKKSTSSRRAKSFKEQNGVNVSFHSEDSGGESIPVVPHLKLNDADDTCKADDSNDDKSVENGADDNDEVWKDVAKCRYIRGYDPPDMRSPDEDPATFVFGRTYNDGFQAQNGHAEAK